MVFHVFQFVPIVSTEKSLAPFFLAPFPASLQACFPVHVSTWIRTPLSLFFSSLNKVHYYACIICTLPFCVSVLLGATRSSMQASCHLSWISCLWGWSTIELGGRENQPVFLDSFPGLYPMGFFQAGR